MRHTPKPWEVLLGKTSVPKELSAKGDGLAETLLIRAKGEWIAEMDVMYVPTAKDGRQYYHLPKRAEANARLISAAPDLLECCKIALDYLDIAHISTIEQFEQAIAKAEGK